MSAKTTGGLGKDSMIKPKKVQRCANRTSKIAWCKSLQKPCNPPQEYNHCQNYQPKTNAPTNSQTERPLEIPENTSEKLLLGTKIGKCDICKTTKKIFLLNYGFNLCEDCINVCTTILEMLPIDETPLPPEEADRQTNQLSVA